MILRYQHWRYGYGSNATFSDCPGKDATPSESELPCEICGGYDYHLHIRENVWCPSKEATQPEPLTEEELALVQVRYCSDDGLAKRAVATIRNLQAQVIRLDKEANDWMEAWKKVCELKGEAEERAEAAEAKLEANAENKLEKQNRALEKQLEEVVGAAGELLDSKTCTSSLYTAPLIRALASLDTQHRLVLPLIPLGGEGFSFLAVVGMEGAPHFDFILCIEPAPTFCQHLALLFLVRGFCWRVEGGEGPYKWRGIQAAGTSFAV